MKQPTAGRRPRILLADDHPSVIEGLTSVLEPQYEVVGAVTQLADLLDEVERLQPDVLISDVRFTKQGNALDLIRAARDSGRLRCPFMIHSMYDSNYEIRQAAAAGAADFMSKHTDPRRLPAVVARLLADGAGHAQKAEPASGETRGTGRWRAAIIDGVRITAHEARVLLLLAQGERNAEIALECKTSVRAVEAHLTECRKRIDLDSRVVLAKWAGENRAALRELAKLG